MIPVRITRSVYIRKGAGASYGVIGVAQASGKTVIMDGAKDDGESFKGISKWYFKKNQNGVCQWYWGGRIEANVNIIEEIPPFESESKPIIPVSVQAYISERFDGTNLKAPVDYNFLSNIPYKIRKTYGKGAVIGILDVPISSNIAFENIIRPGNILTKDSPTPHSNFIAGIIASKTTSNLIGICPFASIIDLAFFDENGNLIQLDSYYRKLINCIKSFGDKKVVVNLSYSMNDSIQFIVDKFKSIENIFFVCSAGTDKSLFNINDCPLIGSSNAISCRNCIKRVS